VQHIDRDSVTLRRTTTIKGDTFRLQSKHVTKREVCSSSSLSCSHSCSLLCIAWIFVFLLLSKPVYVPVHLHRHLSILVKQRCKTLQAPTVLNWFGNLERVQVQTMLEQAGFSRANPYNIVQQGKIAKMSQLTDAERLTMLKEVGGASLYENKRIESSKEMAAQRGHIDVIDESVGFLC
jgi:hypothetical protein